MPRDPGPPPLDRRTQLRLRVHRQGCAPHPPVTRCPGREPPCPPRPLAASIPARRSLRYERGATRTRGAATRPGRVHANRPGNAPDSRMTLGEAGRPPLACRSGRCPRSRIGKDDARADGRPERSGIYCQSTIQRVRGVATRNVVLTDAQSDLVNRLVSSGRYQNASEALRAGLRLLEREEAELSDLRARLAAGLEQARSGDLAEGDGEGVVRRAFAAARARG